MVRRSRQRGFTVIEAAVSLSILGSLAAVAIPVVAREVHASRFVEATEGVQNIAVAAVAYADSAATTRPAAFPPSAPLTPKAVPRGVLESDPEGTWDTPAWKPLAFRPTPGAPDAPAASGRNAPAHAFAFAFDNLPGPPGSAQGTFVAHAHGDLDGDGTTSTFEVRGRLAPSEPAHVIPGLYVEAEVE